MATMPKSRAQQEIAGIQGRAARGEISTATAQELTARAREEQANRMWRDALDTAQGGA